MINPALDFLEDNLFYGLGLPLETLDYNLLKFWRYKADVDLAQLTNNCWFDYRFMHPMLRVYYFADILKKNIVKYNMAVANFFWAKKVDSIASLFLRENKSTITAIFTACWVADSFGIPYDFYLENALEKILSTRQVFRINLFYTESVVNYILDKWAERNISGIYLAKSSSYIKYNHFDNPYADDYQAYLCTNSNNKENRRFYLKTLIYQVEHLGEKYAIKKYGKEYIADL